MSTENQTTKSQWLVRLIDIKKRHTTFSSLCASLEIFRVKLDTTIKGKHAEDADWAVGVKQLLEDVSVFLEHDDIVAAWRCLDAAKQAMIFAYDQNQLDAEASVLRREVEKYRSPVKDAVFDLIGKPEKPKERGTAPVDVHRLDRALRLKNGCKASYFNSIALRRRNLEIMIWILIPAILIIPLLSGLGLLPSPLTDWRQLLAVEIFGVLGAAFTTALTLTKSSLGERIPDRVIGTSVTGLRALIGAAAALAAYAFLEADIFQNVISPSVTESSAGIMAIAFIAGFSERFVIKAISNLPAPEKKEDEEE